MLPTTQTADNTLTPPRFAYSSALGNFRLINFQNSTENILPTYVLVAQIYSDTGQRIVNWAAGNVVLPTPDQDQQITWNANAQQLGRGANTIKLDGGTGNMTVPGTLSVTGAVTLGASGQSGQIASVSVDHAIILRGDTTNPALNYAIMPGDTCAFIEYGGI